MKCPNCGSKVTEGSAFCENCGAKIPPKESKKKEKGSFCPFCGAWNEGDDRFCAECGRDLAEIEDEIQDFQEEQVTGKGGKKIARSVDCRNLYPCGVYHNRRRGRRCVLCTHEAGKSS